MAAIEPSTTRSTRKGRGVPKSKKQSTRIDLTPMVDLGFLLITFFLFTTTLARPKVMALTLPCAGPPTEWRESQTMTLVLSKEHRIYYYQGMGDEAHPPIIKRTGFDPVHGIRQIIMDKNQQVKKLQAAGVLHPGADACFLIKADTNSTYHDLVQVLDELSINDVQMKSVVDITDYDRALISKN